MPSRPAPDFASTQESLVPAKLRVRAGQVVGIVDHLGNDIGLPLTVKSGGDGGIDFSVSGLPSGYVAPFKRLRVVLICGQSNAAGRAPIESTDYIDPRILQWGSYASDATTLNKVGPMTEPMKTPDATTASGKTGPAPWFARSYVDLVNPGDGLLIVHYAVGGTAMVNSRWQPATPGGDLFEGAITAANAAIAAAKAIYPESLFDGIVFAQGESDGDAAVSTSAYQDALTQFVSLMRKRITGATNSWFVIQGMVPEAISNRANYPAIRTAHIAVADAMARCVYVPGVSGYSTDNLHYTTQPGPRIVGALNARAAIAAQLDTVGVTVAPDPVPSAAPTNISLPVISGSLTQGGTLLATSGNWSNYPTSLAYQWKRGGVAISGATAATYTTGASDVGANITVTVTATNAIGSTAATSANFGPIVAAGGGTVVYDFEADSVGTTILNATAAAGVFEIVSAGPAGWSGKFMHNQRNNASATDVLSLNSAVPAAGHSVTWQRGRVGNTARDGFVLCSQAATTVTGYSGLRQGYLVQVNDSTNDVRIYKLASAGLSQLGTTTAHTVPADAMYRATWKPAGTLTLEVSTDSGANWTTLISVTDTTYTTPTAAIQIMSGFASSNPSAAYMDNIVMAAAA